MKDAAIDELAAVEGLGWCAHEPWPFEGVAPGFTATPESDEALAQGLACAARHGLAALVRGGGSALGLGNLPARADFVLDTSGLSGIEELDLEDGVVKVRAGTPVAAVQAAVADAGLELPVDPAGQGATVGGVLASARFGPRRLGQGPVRDCVLGLDVVLPGGERTRCGGRVVKNVTGYDLAKLHTGALGTLGVLTGAWLRLRARPQIAGLWWAPAPEGPDALLRTLAVSRRATTRACATADGELGRAILRGADCAAAAPGERLLLVELAGDEPAVARDALWLEAEHGAEPAPPGEALLAAWRERQGAATPTAADGTPLLRARLGLLPTAMADVLERLSSSVTGTLVQPGVGALFVELPAGADGDAPSLERSLGHIAAACAEARATLQLEALPPAAKSGRDVFGLPAETRALMGRLAREFDPTGLLNPGRLLRGEVAT